VLARRPEVVCVDDLTVGTASAERTFAAARRLADAGITVVGTVQLGKLGGTPTADPEAILDKTALLSLADEIELVDLPPSILIDRVRRGQIVPPDQIPHALATTYEPETLRAERERAFRLVAEHGERRLAAYTGDAVTYEPERQPCIIACAAPWPGMEPLIRRAAALVAQLDGQFLAATVRTAPPGGPEDQLIAEYAVLAEQLGGEFVTLTGASPGSALADYARERQATELLLSRAHPNPSGRFPVLRDLARLASDVELHVLPAE
jgi:two-component system sensor histidine kinase KdpD